MDGIKILILILIFDMLIHMQNNFRSDINFLRMLAVMSVVVNHISPNKLVGGYLGVDIFFVISAYLISSLLLKEYASSGTINLIAFYRRRIFRIAPALSVVLIFTMLASWTLLYYDKLLEVCQSAIFSSIGFANIYFWKSLKLDYFNPTAETESLLHLWSLGVEEQFYFLFPISLLLLWRFKKLFIYMLGLTFVASLILATVLDNYDFVYYNLPTRVFEFIAGVLASIYVHSQKTINEKSSDQQNSIISLLSLVIIAFSLFYIGEKYRLPNHYSLMVVLPTVALLIIGSQSQNKWITKFYNFKVFQLLGLWSYSIYLWHWVLLALTKVIFGLDLPPHINYIILFTSPLIGALSYYYVEEKTRYLKWSFLKGLLIFVLLPLIFSIFSYYYAKKMDKKMEIYKPKFITDVRGYYNSIPKFDKNHYKKLIPVNNLGKKSNIIMVGNSYAAHNVPFIDKITDYLKISYDVRCILGSSMPMLLQNNKVKNKDDRRYYQTKFANNELLNYDIIILANRYTDVNMDDMDYTVKELSRLGKTIILLPVIPELTTLDLTSIMKLFTFLNNNKLDKKAYKSRFLPTNKKLKEFASKYPNTYYIDYNHFLFDKKGRLIYKDGRTSLFYDNFHLSIYGATWLANKYIASGIDDFWYDVSKQYHAKYGVE